MNPELKQRLTGAIVLVVLGVIFLPMLLEKPTESGINTPVQDIDLSVPQTDRREPPSASATVAIPEEVIAQYETPQAEAQLPAELNESLPPELPTAVELSQAEPPVKPEPKQELETKPVVKPPVPEPKKKQPERSDQVKTKKAEQSKPEAKKEETSSETDYVWFIQAGSFSSQANADLLVKRLKSHGFKAFHEELTTKERPFFRVRLGPYTSKNRAEQEKQKLEKAETVRTLIVRLPKGNQ